MAAIHLSVCRERLARFEHECGPIPLGAGTRKRVERRGEQGPMAAVCGVTMVRRALAILVLLAGFVAAPPSAGALDVEYTPHAVKREVLALYDGRSEKAPSETRIHKFAELPLNFLGYKLVYVDINKELPKPEHLARFRGMVSWLVEPMRDPVAFINWLDRATQTSIRYVLISDVAPPEPEHMRPIVNRILGRIGIHETGEFVNVTHAARVLFADPAMVGFERPIDQALPDFAVMTVTGSDVTSHLTVEAPGRNGKLHAALVTTSPAGGYVSDEFAIFYDPNTDRLRWVLNPFAFFKAALGDERFPVPDVTTLSGRRIYFSHIDGDGWNNVSEIEGYREAQVLSSEVVAREAIESYPDLPVTVGLIGGDADPSLGGTKAAQSIARRLFTLPQVEVATHTYTHPFEWRFFERYDRAVEEARIERAQRPDETLWDKARGAAMALGGRSGRAEHKNKYIAGSSDLPRTYLKKPFDLEHEIKGALAFSESFAPPGKKARIVLWSGDTQPFEAAVRATREAGVRNMNGGDSRLDPEYASVFYVPPIARPVGNQRQIYSGNSNENTYTNDWTGPFYGYFNLEKTLVNTETPRRLKPFNLYYHMYIGERPAALAALKHHLNLARGWEVVPVTASRYAAIADSFFDVEITQVDVSAWTVSNRGELHTVRFDAAKDISVDAAASEGVLGSARANGALYVTLDAAVATAKVVLHRGGAADSRPPDDMAPSLLSSRWTFAKRRQEGCSLTVEAEGYGPGEMLWQAAPGQRFTVAASRGGVVLASQEAVSDAEGRLKLSLDVSAIEPLEVGLRCHG
mgnify:CR=1 FL=1